MRVSDEKAWRRYPLPRNRRLDAAIYRNPGQTCFFTLRTAGGRAPFGDPRYAGIAVKCLLGQRAKSCCQLDVYCIMPDHIHLAVTPIKEGMSSLLYVERFKGWSSRLIHDGGWEGGLWQARSYDRVPRVDESLEEIGKYILNNPVRAGLSLTWEDYDWCGIPQPIAIEECSGQEAVSKTVG